MDSGCQVKTYVWKPITHRCTVTGRLKCTYVSFLFRVKRVAQLAPQELNLISQFNFNLALPDIVANKTLTESVLPGKFFFQSYASKPFSSTPCFGDLVFCFSILLMICFLFMSSRWISNLFPRSRSMF